MIRKRKTKALAAIVAAAAIALAGCTSTTGATGGGGSQAAIDPNNLVLVASVINTTNPYMASMIEGRRRWARSWASRSRSSTRPAAARPRSPRSKQFSHRARRSP